MKTKKSELKAGPKGPKSKAPVQGKANQKQIGKKAGGVKKKPQIKKALEKQLDKVKNIIKNEKQIKDAVEESKPSEVEKTPEEIAKLEKKTAKKERQKLRKAEAKATKENANKTKPKPTNKKPAQDLDEDDDETTVKVDHNLITASTVFVGNLPTNTKRVQLIRLFKEYGEVISIRLRTAGGKSLFKHKIRKDAPSLIAFVQLESAEMAKKALALNGTEFKGNHLRVTPSDKKNSAHFESDSSYDTKRTIFVGNLKYSATEDKLREIFSSCGEIDYVRTIQDGDKGCKGVAYVCFKAPDAVGLALELDKTVLDDRPIHVERYSVKKLGAKKKRDFEAQVQPKKQGAFKRIQQKSNQTTPNKSFKKDNDKGPEHKKKGEFRGVKVNGIKKKNNKKKMNDQMKKMAAKIAPKAKGK